MGSNPGLDTCVVSKMLYYNCFSPPRGRVRFRVKVPARVDIVYERATSAIRRSGQYTPQGAEEDFKRKVLGTMTSRRFHQTLPNFGLIIGIRTGSVPYQNT